MDKQGDRRRRWLARRRRRFIFARRRRWWLRRRADVWPDRKDKTSRIYYAARRRRTMHAVRANLKMFKVSGNVPMKIRVRVADCWKAGETKSKPVTWTHEMRNEALARSAAMGFKMVGKRFKQQIAGLYAKAKNRTLEMLPGKPQAGQKSAEIPGQVKQNETDGIVIDTKKYAVENARVLEKLHDMCCKDSPPGWDSEGLSLQHEELGASQLATVLTRQRYAAETVSKCINGHRDPGGGQWGRTKVFPTNPRLDTQHFEQQTTLLLQVSAKGLQSNTDKVHQAVRDQAISTAKMSVVLAHDCARMRASRMRTRRNQEQDEDAASATANVFLQEPPIRGKTIQRRLQKRRSKHRLSRLSINEEHDEHQNDEDSYERPWTVSGKRFARRVSPSSGDLGDESAAGDGDGGDGGGDDGGDKKTKEKPDKDGQPAGQESNVEKMRPSDPKKEALRAKLKGKLSFDRLTRPQIEGMVEGCDVRGPPYCCKNFVRFQCGVSVNVPLNGPPKMSRWAIPTMAAAGLDTSDVDTSFSFGKLAASAMSEVMGTPEQEAQAGAIPLPFRVTDDNLIEFALNVSACNMDKRTLMAYPNAATHLCSANDMGSATGETLGPFGGQFSGVPFANLKSSSAGNDRLCNNARAALMRCSTGGNMWGHIPGAKFWDARGPGSSDKNPLDYTSMEAAKMLRIEEEQTFFLHLIGPLMNVRDSIGIEPSLEPTYFPNWNPQYFQREENLNYAPAHLCKCVKPFYVPNNAQGCKAIRLYNGRGLAGQMCNSRVVDYGEIQATSQKVYICCDKWISLFQGLVKMKYCNKGDGSEPVMTVSITIRMAPMSGLIPFLFHPPVESFYGSCVTYVKVLALGLKYGGPVFALELKRAAREQIVVWSNMQKHAADQARRTIYGKNENEVKEKVKNREMQWQLMKADREEGWREEYQHQDEEYKTWAANCCTTSGICRIIGMLLPVKFYGMMSTMCIHALTGKFRQGARTAYLKKYGLYKQPAQMGVVKFITGMISDIRLKTNVHRVGNSPSGVPVYHFSYLGDLCETRYSGVVAQDIMHFKPSAVGVNSFGYYNVDYSKLDVAFETVNDAAVRCNEMVYSIWHFNFLPDFNFLTDMWSFLVVPLLVVSLGCVRLAWRIFKTRAH